MKLSAKRQQEIYSAVHERMMEARILLAKHPQLSSTKLGTEIDFIVAQAANDAASAAIRAAEGAK